MNQQIADAKGENIVAITVSVLVISAYPDLRVLRVVRVQLVRAVLRVPRERQVRAVLRALKEPRELQVQAVLRVPRDHRDLRETRVQPVVHV